MARARIAGPTPAIKGRTGRLVRFDEHGCSGGLSGSGRCVQRRCGRCVVAVGNQAGYGLAKGSQRTPYRVAYMPSKICSNPTTFSELRRSCSVASTVLHGRSKPRYLGLPTNQTALSPAASWA